MIQKLKRTLAISVLFALSQSASGQGDLALQSDLDQFWGNHPPPSRESRNQASVIQDGVNNAISIAQRAEQRGANYVAATQLGNGNKAETVTQIGMENLIYLYQAGSYNESTFFQSGVGNQARVVQRGSRNQAHITQIGSHLRVGVAQIGNGQMARVFQRR